MFILCVWSGCIYVRVVVNCINVYTVCIICFSICRSGPKLTLCILCVLLMNLHVWPLAPLTKTQPKIWCELFTNYDHEMCIICALSANLIFINWANSWTRVVHVKKSKLVALILTRTIWSQPVWSHWQVASVVRLG